MELTGSRWGDRALVLTGRGATGLLPVLLMSLTSRALGLDVMGTFATALALALGLAELADIFSERHIPRTLLSDEATDEQHQRIGAFNTLRFGIALVGSLVGVVILAFITERQALAATVIVLLSVVSVLVAKTQYATALAERRYVLLGVVPVVALALAATVAAVLLRLSLRNLWAVVLALHAAKLSEVALLANRLGLPRLLLDVKRVRREWLQTRFLFFQGVLSAASARLIVPLVAAIAGAVAAGLLAIGLSFLGIISLAAVAITVPAYRWVLEFGRSHGLADAFRRTRHDWLWAVGLSLLLTGLVAAMSRPLLGRFFHVADYEAQLAVVLIVFAGMFETVNLFAGSYYHACFKDRQLFVLSLATMALTWVGLVIGVRLAGVQGMGAGFVLSRGVGALILYAPIGLSLRAQRAAPFMPERHLGD